MKTITFDDTEWKLVPIVPTSGDAYSMVMAGAVTLEIQDYLLAVHSNTSRALAVYNAMLAAAPVCEGVAAKPVAWLVSHADEPDCVTAWMHPFDCLPVNSKWKNIPLYTAPSAAAIRNTALEDAASICDSVNSHDNPMTATDCADATRALKSKDAPVDKNALDTKRLEFMLANTGFIVTGCPKTQGLVQLCTQDEAEHYITLSGIDKWFATERDAIDAAIALQKEKP